jgi:hypothetical protein
MIETITIIGMNEVRIELFLNEDLILNDLCYELELEIQLKN